MKNIVLLFFFYFFSFHPVYGQTKSYAYANPPIAQINLDFPMQESIFMQINSPFFVVGETLLFKLSCLNKSTKRLSTLSSIAYVELIDETATPILQSKAWLISGLGSGDIYLPSSIKSGNYTIVAYTNWMRNFSSSEVFHKQITIINPFVKLSIQRKSKPMNITNKNPNRERSLTVDVRTSKSLYRTREKVVIDLQIKDSVLNSLLLSVRGIEKDYCENQPPSTNYSREDSLIFKQQKNRPQISKIQTLELSDQEEKYQAQKTKFDYLPEVRGNLLTGKVTGDDSSTIQGQIIYLSVPAKPFLFLTSKTDSKGRFYFCIDALQEGNIDVILQFNPKTCFTCELSLDQIGLENYSKFVPTELSIDSSYRRLIEKRSLQTQIENAYYEQKRDSIIKATQSQQFYGKPDKIYRLDDYVRFSTVEDIFIEYMLEVVVKKNRGNRELKVMNIKKHEPFSENPLILIDGIPIFKSEQLLDYNPIWIERVEIIGRKYYYGPLEFEGIISVITYEGNGKGVLVPTKEKITPIQSVKHYYNPDYGKQSEKLSRIPDYRTQLYWNPNIQLSNNHQTLEFYTSDLEGDFEILLEGVSDTGNPIRYSKVFSVNNTQN